ncbi:Fanconi anemia group J protein homolog [Chelonus insularis]|uniref:Fanconi anemia group J protein homolog n=1 Tax=Chelonus insularis TaxID=460826 RepID=UPI00158B818F|nr:Fanconi anemia group J protein homolog [Chelonus insularis]
MATIIISDDEDSATDIEFQPTKKLAANPRFFKNRNNSEDGSSRSSFKFEEYAITDDESASDSSINNQVSNRNSAQQVSSDNIQTNQASVSSNSSSIASASNNVRRPKPIRIPKKFFNWAFDNPENRGDVKKRVISPLENGSKKRNIVYHNFSDDEDDSSSSDSLELPNTDVKLPPTIAAPTQLMIAGVNVMFPLKPYGSQVAVMNALIRGCTKGEHALLESPTGSGKTLALLCGALAFQRHYAAQYRDLFQEYVNQCCENYDMEHEESSEKENKNCQIENKNFSAETKKPCEEPKKIPTIYYGSRTHRQIAQVIKELKRTAYADARMTILSSRDFTCLQQSNRNKTELCNELLDPFKKIGCPFYNDLKKRSLSYKMLDKMIPSPWDIEELYNFGEKLGSCPYYMARDLMPEAQIVFCPYNYLIDPSIRRSMQINLKDEIVILDEAHNIEDICRDSASATFKVDELVDIVKDCTQLEKGCYYTQKDEIASFTHGIIAYCEAFQKFIESIKLECQEGQKDTMTSKYWSGNQLVELMDINHISHNSHRNFKQVASKAIEHHNKSKEPSNDHNEEDKIGMSLSSTTIRELEKITFFIDMLTSKDYSLNFRALIKEKIEKVHSKSQNPHYVSPTQGPRTHRVRMLEFLCMNPGVIFSSLAKTARSIILASGTLSPTSSFSSELSTKFPNMLHANHVVPKEQVFIKAISQGPNKIPLRATYQNVNSWKFQDEVGQVLIDVCETVPYGVLCFFSSYTAMKTLTDRWWQNGTMTKLFQCKKVMQEPRVNAELAGVMDEYRETIRTCDENEDGVTGAILFAVFRGKIAEGIDFSDNEARCVITLGIPYAVRNDPSVKLKVDFNDLYHRENNLLKGQEWYTVQAYRALNQALGRCIRHRNDWGAILLVDDRFLLSHNQSYLPNWVRSMWANRKADYNLRVELQQFVKERIKAGAERLSKPI